MMKTTIDSLARGLSIFALFVACMVMPPVPAHAQYADVVVAADRFSREELAQLLAPIALYPDALLSQILMASTYPIEVVEADRWLRRHSHLQGDALDWALVEQNWDPSVKALCHFPSILALMSERIAETSDLGNAFLAQEAEVMAMVQELRAAAYAQGHLSTNGQQTVIVERETIIIEPVNPRVVFVPYYDPFHVYGPWWYPAYPPYYWGPPGVRVVGIAYWPAAYFSISYSNWSYFDWHRHVIYVDTHKRPKYVRHDHWVHKAGPWKHDSAHRRGAGYRDAGTARKYGPAYSHPPVERRDRRDAAERGNLTRDRERRPDDRPWLNQEQRRDERSRLERNRPGSAQPDRSERQLRERSGGERQEAVRVGPVRINRNRQERERVQRPEVDRERQRQQILERKTQERQVRERSGGERQEPVRFDRNRQERERVQRPEVDRDRQRQQMADRERQAQQRLEPARVLRERAERQQPERSRGGREWQRSGQQQEVRERVQSVQQPGRRDGNLTQGQAGRNEYKSRPGGQINRQGAAIDARGGGRSGNENRTGRDQRRGDGR